jgi:hypothetical protein
MVSDGMKLDRKLEARSSLNYFPIVMTTILATASRSHEPYLINGSPTFGG